MFQYKVETLQGIFEDNCDILIILDACRYDYFIECNNIQGELKKLYLKCVSTLEWLKSCWSGKYDITYVSANPNINSITGKYSRGYYGKEHFKEVIDVWNFGWSEELGTVHPDTVTRVAKDYVDNNLIVHYIQPHAPYIGRVKLNIYGWGELRSNILKVPFKRREEKGVSIQLLREAYKGNLELVLKSVNELLKYIPKGKKVVITSDHSELLGEKNAIGHGLDHNREIPVPYLKVEM